MSISKLTFPSTSGTFGSLAASIFAAIVVPTFESGSILPSSPRRVCDAASNSRIIPICSPISSRFQLTSKKTTNLLLQQPFMRPHYLHRGIGVLIRSSIFRFLRRGEASLQRGYELLLLLIFATRVRQFGLEFFEFGRSSGNRSGSSRGNEDGSGFARQG
jgi:hypothetical protein